MIENIIVFALSAAVKAVILLFGTALIIRELYKYKVAPLFK